MARITIPNDWAARPYQRPTYNNFGFGKKYQRAACVWHRRAGKDSMGLNLTAREMFKRVGTYWHLFPEQTQARRAIWNGVDKKGRRILEQVFPGFLKTVSTRRPHGVVKRVSGQEMLIELVNGSIWQMAGSDNYDSLVGSNPVGVVFSEYSIANPLAWDYIRPILLENGGWAIFIYTPRGRTHGYQLFSMALKNDDWIAERLTYQDTGALTDADIQSERDSGMSDNKIKQEYFCFKADAMVATHDRVKPISEIAVGDVVLTHTGRMRKVEQTSQHDFDGEMITVEAWGSRPITCTDNHPLQVCEPGTQSYKWIAAKDIEPGQYLVTPRLKQGVPVVRPELARVIAWYVAEGSAAKTALSFSIGYHESDYVSDLVSDLKALGVEPKVSRNGNVSVVLVASVEMCDFLIGQCGSLSFNKRLPMALLRGNEADVWDTLMKADGCIHQPKSGYDAVYAYATTSEGLAQQVQILGASLGYAGSYSIKAERTDIIEGRSVSCRARYLVQMRRAKVAGAASRTRPAKNGMLGKVRRVSSEPYVGKVFNFKVQYDSSYVVNGRSVHNCDFEAENDDQLISSSSVMKGQKLPAMSHINDPMILGVDVARFGDDKSVIYPRRGRDARTMPIEVYSKLDTMQFAGRVAAAIEKYRPDGVFVDLGGIGAGVVDRLIQLNHSVIGVDFGGTADRYSPGMSKTANKRSEMWTSLRDALKTGLAIPEDPRLEFELLSPNYTYDADNAILLEKKKDMKKRGLQSPDIADALALTYAYPVEAVSLIEQEEEREADEYDPFGWSK